ncbi:putative mitogen-activated protein kinase kinase kinase 7 interacting protein 1 isoform 1 [Operophtera brumata]|uniref:Putative mitogen-activated protein kinase kinase kinase 7 interacting protein 1 isoform 1 n=1 Tax=Operophtera brumata TaxID=104452 RepID=A0A0L7LKJ3_OPEBR|nr:putative mitogen-activated protein kinase kinase kinase 7 interacting protein 1 isoform 1 [Operophtera brumata]
MIARPWTDDLPKCRNTVVASYFSRLGGTTNATDDYLCFYCQTEDNLNAFVSVEKAYIENYDGMIAERTKIKQRYSDPAEGDRPTPVRGRHCAQYLGNQTGTRCLGNYLVKGLYRAFPTLSAACAEPVVPAPEIHGPIHLDDSCSSEQTNKQLAQIIVENFRKQTEFKQVSQSVLEEIEDEFVSYCFKNNLSPRPNTHMSLLIRNFNFLAPVVSENPQAITKNASVRFNPIVQSKSNTLLNEIDSENYSSTNTESIVDTNRSIESTSDIDPSGRPFDPDRKIKPYVDFTCYFENVAKGRRNGSLPDFIK